ncbi:Serine/threonine-protein phosphatase 5 [Smittium mucronatum]|uniref:Serine/threonine-protein phosphatase 5 n=1 Tax=Smittium mucronatum TaxID=133383 RepID=A0A1R0H9B0_9FUNG|nr:Serine/threonine-protein phosphatase 5 [Smittium mucronatum]
MSSSNETRTSIEIAEEIKKQANTLFAEKKYLKAIEEYTKAIELNPNVPAYYTNRAQCYILTEGYGAAIM